MSPYNIDRDTRLQHHLLDAVESHPSFFSRLGTNLSALFVGFFKLSRSIAYIALWAAAIYFTCKGLYHLFSHATTSMRSYAHSVALEQQEKDLESQYPETTPELSFTPDSVGSPMSVGSPALSTTSTPHSNPLGSSEALARSMKKLGIYVENSAVLPAPDVQTPINNTRMLSNAYSDYTFAKEHAMIKTH